MDTVIKDTNVLLDLYNTGLIRHCHKLGITFYTTNHIINEILDSEQWHFYEQFIADGFLKVYNYEGMHLIELLTESARYKTFCNLSQADCSVMLLADQFKCRLLTSDQRLRKQAEKRGIQVNGILWIVQQLVDSRIVSPGEMIGYLNRYIETNSSAPVPQIKELISIYKQKA